MSVEHTQNMYAHIYQFQLFAPLCFCRYCFLKHELLSNLKLKRMLLLMFKNSEKSKQSPKICHDYLLQMKKFINNQTALPKPMKISYNKK